MSVEKIPQRYGKDRGVFDKIPASETTAERKYEPGGKNIDQSGKNSQNQDSIPHFPDGHPHQGKHNDKIKRIVQE